MGKHDKTAEFLASKNGKKHFGVNDAARHQGQICRPNPTVNPVGAGRFFIDIC